MSTDDVSDYYAAFDLDRNAGANELGRSLDQALRTWAGRASRAPDPKKRRDAEDKVALVGEARTHLLDPARRTAYDRRLRDTERRAKQAEQRARQAEQRAKEAERKPEAVPPPRPAVGGGRNWVARAREHLREGNDEAALYDLRQAVHHNEHDGDAWRLLGSIHAKHGNYADAVQEYERARVLYPGDALTHTCIALAHAAQGRLDTAADWHVSAARLAPADFGLTVAAADALFATANYDAALAWNERALQLRPDHSGVRDRIGTLWRLRAESAMSWHPTRQRWVIVTASGAAQVTHCVEQAEAVGPSDTQLLDLLGAYRSDAARAPRRTWRGRGSMFLVMALCVSVLLFARMTALSLTVVAALVGLTVLMGIRPRWRHALHNLPAQARPDVRNPS
ncbi:tetratricopeptide repeat protein [Streptomyces sp. NBC_01438]|uniref:tetratricopeptide repeat protein n=1 Tax=Streptomyces sp. NBC_01438 TaxID=2903866 RepID=UPI0032550B18